jgi:ABC-2 type transport system permease protein
VRPGHELRVLRAFLRLGATATLTYRTQALVWLLSTTMPLIMIAFFSAVVRDAPLGHYSTPQVIAYFLATFIARNLTASWISWQISLEIRDGSLGARLLLPVHPVVAFVSESVGAMPVRVAGSLVVAVVMMVMLGGGAVTHAPVLWLLWCLSIIGGWLISTLVSLTIGALAFFFDSSAKIMDAWLAALFVFGGYLVPVDLFPAPLRALLAWLPFRYQIGLPVELMVGAHDVTDAMSLVARQWVFVVVGVLVTVVTWRRGLARFAAYGG